jgi:hypothetical protein
MPKDNRPPEKWWDKCMKKVKSAPLCGWIFWKRLKPYKPEDKKKADDPETRAARARKRAILRRKGELEEDLTLDNSTGSYTTTLAGIFLKAVKMFRRRHRKKGGIK